MKVTAIIRPTQQILITVRSHSPHDVAISVDEAEELIKDLKTALRRLKSPALQPTEDRP